MKHASLLKRLLIWRLRHISNRQFILVLSVVVGLAAGLSAVLLKNSVHALQYLLDIGISKQYANYLYFAYPTIGMLLAVLFIKFFIGSRVGHGIPNILFAISSNNSYIKRHYMYSSLIASTLTVGFGGSVGLEGPAVVTGGAIGSNIGRLMHLNYKETTLMIGCACAAAIASIFKAPIAAVVFALEVIMLDLTMSSLVPLLLASITGTITSYLLMGQQAVYAVDILQGFNLKDTPFYILLGIMTGFISLYFTRVYIYFGVLFEKIPNSYIRLFVGSLFLGILIFLFPSLYGEGYQVINSCLKGDFSYLFEKSVFISADRGIVMVTVLLFLVVSFKVIATVFTFGGGGVGGIFAPSLFMGANAGSLFASVFAAMGVQLSSNNFALVGMSGMIAGIIHAPLTGIFMIADITGGYSLFVPLMLTATVSYATIRYFEPNSVYTMQLAKRKQLITHHKDRAVLSLMRIDKIIETDFTVVRPSATLGDLVQVIASSRRNVYPVVDKDENLVGVITLNDIRDIMFRTELYPVVKIRDLMYFPEAFVYYEDSMEDIAKKIQQTGHFNFPVLKNGKYLGFVSRANVFSAYRKMLKDFSEE